MRIAVALLALLLAAPTAGAASETSSALEARALADLAQFTRWLRAGPAPAHGFVGEVGWPGNPAAGGDPRWNGVAARWYEAAGRQGLTVAAWAAGDLWAPSYKLLVYAGAGASPSPQATVVEAQRDPALRGVNVAGAEFGAPVDEARSSFSNLAPGRYGSDYAYPSQATFDGLAARGIRFVRLPVRWERLQPALEAPLDPAEAGRLLDALGRARLAGLDVVVDVHNYGAYYLADGSSRHGVRRAIGSREVPVEAFGDLWRRLAELLRGNAAVAGYGLMNEPWGMPGGARGWEAASRAAVAAVRATGDRTRIFVQSYDWGGTRQFAREHPRGPWLSDPNVWYEAHQYFDSDRSARYVASFDEEAKLAARR